METEHDEGLFVGDDRNPSHTPATPEMEVKQEYRNMEMTTEDALINPQGGHQSQPEPAADDDGDLMEIDISQATTFAQSEWSKTREKGGIINLDDVVKQEPIDLTYGENADSTDASAFVETKAHQPANNLSPFDIMMARQREMLGRANNPRGLPIGAFIPRGSQAAVEPVLGTPRVSEERRKIDIAMNVSRDDNAWMGADPDEGTEWEDLNQLCKRLEIKEINGKITQNEKIELQRARSRLKILKRMREINDDDKDTDPLPVLEPDSLFVSDDDSERTRAYQSPAARDISQGDHELAFLLQELSEDGNPQEVSSGQGKTRRPRKKVAKDAREAYHQRHDELREKERNKLQKKRARDAASSKKTAAKSNGTKRKATKGKKKTSSTEKEYQAQLPIPEDGSDKIALNLLSDLMNNDPIHDRLCNSAFEVGAEPAIEAGTLKTQFQRLVNNIPGGGDDKRARSDRTKLQEAAKSFGFAKVKAKDGKWLVKGMKSPLYHHQLLGAKWMVERELSTDAPHGGLLADGMGLGKTVQVLACMVSNPPTKADLQRKTKATLIVVPSSVIEQWMDETRVHATTEALPKIMRYRTKNNVEVEILQDLDVVITSYHEVMQQFPFPNSKDKEDPLYKEDPKLWWKRAADRKMGPLHKIDWFRVVLDEAHAIKNNSARTSLACQNLKSIYRWCLTGTPLLNRLEELFPYLRFLKANYAMDWDSFRAHFCDSDKDASFHRMGTLLSYTMMRRTMSTTIMGRPIIVLPAPVAELRHVDFSREERTIYRITENRFRANLNKHIENGDAQKNYSVFFVQLLRLRQCTSHPFMLERTIRECWTSEDVSYLQRALHKYNMSYVPIYKQCALWVDEGQAQRAARGQGRERSLGPQAFGLSDFGTKFDFDKPIASLNVKVMYERMICQLCSDVPEEPVLTDCGHIFCIECLGQHLQQATLVREDGATVTICPTCDLIFQACSDLQSPNAESSDSESNSGRRTGKIKQEDIVSKGRDALHFEPGSKDSTWVTRSDDDSQDFPLAPSAKTMALKSILLKGFDEAPLDKVVIYVQFRLLARIIGRICQSEKWGFLYLSGDASLGHRSKAVKKFRDDPDIKILIAGLKCGGIGLNFPFANRCISLDLWWNHAVEQQAFGRIFRIGQSKTTYMTRIVVKETIDMRLLRMQKHKLATCERAITEGNESAARKQLSLNELASLFGFLRTDRDENIVRIEPDFDRDDWDGLFAPLGEEGKEAWKQEGEGESEMGNFTGYIDAYENPEVMEGY